MNTLQTIITAVWSVIFVALMSIGVTDYPWKKGDDSLALLRGKALLEPINDADVHLALIALKQSDTISAERVGVNARKSPEYQAMQLLQSEVNAERYFKALIKEDNPTAQVYGLLGLQVIGSEKSVEFSPYFQNSSAKIYTLSGCLANHKTVSDFNFAQWAKYYQKN